MNNRSFSHWQVRGFLAAVAVMTAMPVRGAPPVTPRAGSVLDAAPPEFVGTAEHELGIPSAPLVGDVPDGWEPGVCDSCDQVGCSNHCLRFYGAWGRVDYLLWWRKGADLPPLVSTGPLTGAGAILFGGDDVGSEIESGGRAEAGLWFDACQGRGVTGRFYALGEETLQFNSAGLTNVARPFIDVTPNSPAFGMENALIVNAPGGPTGTVNVRMTADVFGGDVFYRRALCQGECSRLDFLVGYQMSRVDEDLAISHQFAAGGVTVTGSDFFDTQNEFHGVEVGLLAGRRDCRWTLDALAKVGMGNMDQSVRISGMESRQPPLTTTTGSLLALPTNIGSYSQNEFAVVPELGVNLAYQLNNCWDFTVGYTFIYWSDISRPGDQIDRAVNATQTSGGTLTGQARPQFRFVDGEYWVQGVNFGLTARF